MEYLVSSYTFIVFIPTSDDNVDVDKEDKNLMFSFVRDQNDGSMCFKY